MKLLDSPCKDCAQRELGCHSSCDKYKEYRNKVDELNKAKVEHTSKYFPPYE